jgi:hypothetical protein
MRKKKHEVIRIHEFVVNGVGSFPIDMFRFDLCYPKSEEDSATIEKSFRQSERGEHSVRLVSSKAPTLDRWRTFGWKLSMDV